MRCPHGNDYTDDGPDMDCPCGDRTDHEAAVAALREAAKPEPDRDAWEAAAYAIVALKDFEGFTPWPDEYKAAEALLEALAKRGYRVAPLPSDTPADGLTADTIAARALYATGGNVPTPKAPIVDMFEEVRRWVASIGSTNLDIGRKVTKADALVVIDRILGDLR